MEMFRWICLGGYVCGFRLFFLLLTSAEMHALCEVLVLGSHPEI